MKKATLAIAIIFIGSLFLNSQDLMAQTKNVANKVEKKEAEKENTVLTWDKSKHVFGSIEHDKAVYAEFKFTNDGKEPIAISKVGVTCGCTNPAYPKEPVKPGSTGTIKLRFDAKAPGFFKKAAKVHFSDGTIKELEIEGKVQVRMSSVKKSI